MFDMTYLYMWGMRAASIWCSPIRVCVREKEREREI